MSETRKLSPEVVARQAIEREIVLAFIKTVLDAGYVAVIDNGGDDDERIRVKDIEHASKEIMATDEEHVYVYDPVGQGRWGAQLGWAFFVYGNDGWDVLADYTENLEKLELLFEVEKLAKKHTPE